ncbi:MAG: hypothetical protein KAI24_23470 [Planctomycetes bacterium]|nr:hypothetical protein [Planctomycetota bacterium]
MSKHAPDHHDADLVLKLYDLRREAVMRESRDALNADYWPRDADEAVAVLAPDHPLNRAYRQVSTYWEMAYGMAKHGVVNTDYLLENTGEGMLLFAKVEPWLAQMRAAAHPRIFQNAEWVANSGEFADVVLERFRRMVRDRAN